MASPKFFNRTKNLQGQLPCWRKNQGLRLTFWQEYKAFNHRDYKCRSLTRTGLRATDDVGLQEPGEWPELESEWELGSPLPPSLARAVRTNQCFENSCEQTYPLHYPFSVIALRRDQRAEGGETRKASTPTGPGRDAIAKPGYGVYSRAAGLLRQRCKLTVQHTLYCVNHYDVKDSPMMNPKGQL